MATAEMKSEAFGAKMDKVIALLQGIKEVDILIKIMSVLGLQPGPRMDIKDRRSMIRALNRYLNNGDNIDKDTKMEEKFEKILEIQMEYCKRRSRQDAVSEPPPEEESGGARSRYPEEPKIDIPGLGPGNVLLGDVAPPPVYQYDPRFNISGGGVDLLGDFGDVTDVQIPTTVTGENVPAIPEIPPPVLPDARNLFPVHPRDQENVPEAVPVREGGENVQNNRPIPPPRPPQNNAQNQNNEAGQPSVSQINNTNTPQNQQHQAIPNRLNSVRHNQQPQYQQQIPQNLPPQPQLHPVQPPLHPAQTPPRPPQQQPHPQQHPHPQLHPTHSQPQQQHPQQHPQFHQQQQPQQYQQNFAVPEIPDNVAAVLPDVPDGVPDGVFENFRDPVPPPVFPYENLDPVGNLAPVHNFIAPGQNVRAPGQNVPVPVHNFMAPGQNVRAPGQNVPAPVHNFIAPGQHVPAPAQNVIAPGRVYQNYGHPVVPVPNPPALAPAPGYAAAAPVAYYGGGRLRECRITGKVMDPGEKDGLTYGSLMYQIECAVRQGYPDVDICAALIRATTSQSLRSLLETIPGACIADITPILRAHFTIRNVRSVFIELGKGKQRSDENALQFFMRMVGIRELVLRMNREENGDLTPQLIQSQFQDALSTGLSGEIRLVIRMVLRTPNVPDNVLMKEISDLMISKAESEEKDNEGEDVSVNSLGVVGLAKSNKKEKKNQMLTEICKIAADVKNLNEIKPRLDNLERVFEFLTTDQSNVSSTSEPSQNQNASQYCFANNVNYGGDGYNPQNNPSQNHSSGQNGNGNGSAQVSGGGGNNCSYRGRGSSGPSRGGGRGGNRGGLGRGAFNPNAPCWTIRGRPNNVYPSAPAPTLDQNGNNVSQDNQNNQNQSGNQNVSGGSSNNNNNSRGNSSRGRGRGSFRGGRRSGFCSECVANNLPWCAHCFVCGGINHSSADCPFLN